MVASLTEQQEREKVAESYVDGLFTQAKKTQDEMQIENRLNKNSEKFSDDSKALQDYDQIFKNLVSRLVLDYTRDHVGSLTFLTHQATEEERLDDEQTTNH